jgi:hypothetical protein
MVVTARSVALWGDERPGLRTEVPAHDDDDDGNGDLSIAK